MSRSRPLFGLRQHRRQIAELEAEGKNLWADELYDTARIKLVHAVGGFVGNADFMFDDKIAEVAKLVSSQAGIISLSHAYDFRSKSSTEEILQAILHSRCEKAIDFSIIEAIWDIVPHYPGNPEISPRTRYTEEIRTVFEDCRISYDFVEGNIIPRSEQIMHSEIIVPTLTLLSGRSNFVEAEQRYIQAIRSLGEGRFDDSITDASAALEAVFDALKCSGNVLDKRFRVAQQNGLLAAHDKKLVDWISADRVAKGDPHTGDGQTTRDDAWLLIYVIGAVILRLASSERR
ncbi:MAG: hypothetical protein OXI32_04550 [bacterium]|nr:hypothetical protein [bacterium]